MAERDEFFGSRVTLMGLGGFGGGEGAARYLAERGARVTVTDLRSEDELAEALGRLGDLPITYHLDGHADVDFTDTDVVIVNPAVKPNSPYLRLARRAGVRLDTAVNIFLRRCRARVLGVTGSNGKSTTARLAFEMIRRGGRRAWLGGNLGGSLLGDLAEMGPGDVMIMELSSFQLHRLPWSGRAPDVAVALNVTPNHLDWHGTFDAYASAKRNIVTMQKPDDFAVLHTADDEVRRWRYECGGGVFCVTETETSDDGAWIAGSTAKLKSGERRAEASLASLALPGRHNRANAACAASAAWLVGTPIDAIEAAIADCRPLPHRLETVATLGGVQYVEDSVSTTPESAIAALNSYKGPVHLIAGGSSKGTPFEELGRAIAERAATVALIGRTADEIEAAVRAWPESQAEIVRADSLRDAVIALRARAHPGSVVLLSPACASFDMFADYVDRAEQFRQLVAEIPSGGGSKGNG